MIWFALLQWHPALVQCDKCATCSIYTILTDTTPSPSHSIFSSSRAQRIMGDTNFFRRSRILLRRILEHKETGVHETSSGTHETRSTSSLLLNLPSDTILDVTDSPEQEYRVLLSLSCKSPRSLLSSHLDLSLFDLGVRTKFLQIQV